jgi:hypothetical protein
VRIVQISRDVVQISRDVVQISRDVVQISRGAAKQILGVVYVDERLARLPPARLFPI